MCSRFSTVISPSRKVYSSSSASWQVLCSCSSGSGTGGSLLGGNIVGRAFDQAAVDGKVVQPLLQRLSSAMQSTHHGTDRDVEDLGDLLVGEALDVGQQDRHPEGLRQGLEGVLHLVVGEELEHRVLGALGDPGLVDAAEAPVEVEVLDVGEVGLVGSPLLLAVPVDVGVGEDPEEP